MLVKGLYTILLGIFLTLFIGIGINTFYPEPVYKTPDPCLSPVLLKQPQSNLDVENMNRECERSQYILKIAQDRYVQINSSIALAAAVIFLFLGMTTIKRVEVFSSGFLYGSIFTLLYSVARGLGSNQALFKFILISISLVLVAGVGYFRFVKESLKK